MYYLYQKSNTNNSSAAYVPQTPPLSPAARAQIVAALCERANKKQAARTASNVAANAKWKQELLEISKQPIKQMTLPALISLPSTSRQHQSIAPLMEEEEEEADVTHVETLQVQTAEPVTTAPVHEENQVSEEMAVTELKTQVEAQTNVDVDVNVEVQSVESLNISVDTTKDVIAEEQSEGEVPGAETGVARPILFDISRLIEKGEDEEVGEDEQKEEKSNEGSTAFTVEEEEIKEFPGAQSGVVRPLLFDGIGKVWNNFQRAVTKRAEEDIKKLKRNVSLPEAGGAVGAVGSVGVRENSFDDDERVMGL